MIRVLVCGGRHYADRERVRSELDRLRLAHPKLCIIHGGATGADALAEHWAAAHRVARHRFPAQWGKHGKAAGPIRNQQMLDKGRPDLVLAFPGGAGTADMVARARAAGIRVHEVPHA